VHHRREARPAWWWLFERRDHMTAEELVVMPRRSAASHPSAGRPRTSGPSCTRSRFRLSSTSSHRATSLARTIDDLEDIAGNLKLRRGPSLKDVALAPLSPVLANGA